MSLPRAPASRHIRLYATLAVLTLGRFPNPASAATVSSVPVRPLRTQDWDLAWRAFIGAGEVEDAFALTQRAVAAQPRSRRWLDRLAESARWSNHPRTALAALSRLALDLHDTSQLQPALKLAIELGDEDRAIPLLRELIRLGLATPAQRRMLSGMYEDVGEPERAIRELRRQFARHPRPRLLWQQAVIYRAMGAPARELATLRRYRGLFGPGPKVMLAIATTEYVQGRLPKALDALLAAQTRARPADTAYWQTLSGLAWMLGRYRLAASAAQVLIDTGKADATLYERAVYVEQHRHPGRAFAIAELGWTRTRAPALFLAMLGVASARRPATPWLARAFARLGPGEAPAFADQPFYWTCLAELRSAERHRRAALIAYRRALRLRPGDDALLAGYLWLLIDSHDLAPIAANLDRLAGRAAHSPALRSPLAAAYQELGQPERALIWLQAQWPLRRDDPLWLIDYADALARTGRSAAAWTVRRRAYDLLARRTVPSARRSERRLSALARLAASLAPGDPARRLIDTLSREPDSPAARLTVLASMLGERKFSLAHWWSLRAFLRDPPPDWAQLAQAVATNDGPALARLLGRRDAPLSRRARAQAAAQLGWQAPAVSLAYESLADDPHDAHLQRQFDALALARADTFGAAATAIDWSGLLAERAGLRANPWLSPRDRLDLRLDVTRQRVVDRAQLGYVPPEGRSARLTWEHASGLGRLRLDLGAGRNLASWGRIGLGWQKRWGASLETALSATAGGRALDTAALSVAGLEDRLEARANARLTSRAAVQLALEAGRLRAQGGGALGALGRLTLVGEYRPGLPLPGLTLEASVSGAHYERAAHLPARLLPLVPAGQRAAAAFFVPQSFVQACGGAHLDLRYETAFTESWRPYAGADLCANSVSGRGYDLTAGIATPVLGPDHLSLSVNLENDVGTHHGRTAEVLLRYRHYFTPTH
jgi:tetratricopeptide (TPR) repeat protein